MPETTTHEPPAELTPRRRRALLVVIALALMMVVSAVSGLNVALPDLAAATGATQTQVTWIVDAYTVVFVGLLLPAGALGDRFGRRGILLAGLVVFGAAAAVAMAVTSPATLIALRAVMGIGAAAVMPTTLSIITTSFPPEERGRAVGVWVGVAGGGAVIGLFGSGVLLEFFSWSSFFGLNVALAVLALLGALRFVPGSRETEPPALDPVGGLAGLVGVVGVVFAIIEGPGRGWSDPITITALGVGALGLVAFVGWELHTPAPLLDVRLFRLRGFSTGAITLTVQFFGSFGFFYIVLQYLQYIDGLSPLMSAVSLAPLPVVLIPLARTALRIADRFGLNRVMGGGLALSGAGLLLLSRVLTVDLTYWHLAAGLVVFAAGMGLAGTPGTTAVTSSLPPSKQGVASAVNDTSRELGSALGIAILGSFLGASYRSGLTPIDGVPQPALDAARSSIAFLRAGSAQLNQLGPAGAQLADAARSSFVDAARGSFLIAGTTLLITAATITLLAPRRPPTTTDDNHATNTTDAPASTRPQHP